MINVRLRCQSLTKVTVGKMGAICERTSKRAAPSFPLITLPSLAFENSSISANERPGRVLFLKYIF